MKQNYPCAVCGHGRVTVYLDPISLSAKTVQCRNCQAEMAIELSEKGHVTLWPLKYRGAATY